MTLNPTLARSLRLQAQACVTFGSPFSGALLDAAANDVEAGGPTARLFGRWAGATTRDLLTDAAPVRFLGALHDLVLGGDFPVMSAAYPSRAGPGDPLVAWQQARAIIELGGERISAFMDHEPQTNEVRRSACLLGGFLSIAADSKRPLRCFEVGASAGLNQLWDRYHYDLGTTGQWGDPKSPVAIDTQWTGSPPPLWADVIVTERAACDRRPLDLRDADRRRRLRAYVWAGQVDRQERLEAAMTMAVDQQIVVECEDAIGWTRRRAGPRDGHATVLYHSVFWQYLPAASQSELSAVLRGHGDAATATAPFAWLRMEPPPHSLADMELRLTLWPGGEDRLLARVHPHGAAVTWCG